MVTLVTVCVKSYLFKKAFRLGCQFLDGISRTLFKEGVLNMFTLVTFLTLLLEVVNRTVGEILEEGSQTNILSYIEHANEEIQKIEKSRTIAQTKKIRDLYRLSPRRAMKYYINTNHTPNCTISMNQMRNELAKRWRDEPFDADNDNREWPTPFKLTQENKDYIISEMQNKELFKSVIQSRDITSAHGPDGIGYCALKLNADAGAEMLSMIDTIELVQKSIKKIQI